MADNVNNNRVELAISAVDYREAVANQTWPEGLTFNTRTLKWQLPIDHPDFSEISGRFSAPEMHKRWEDQQNITMRLMESHLREKPSIPEASRVYLPGISREQAVGIEGIYFDRRIARQWYVSEAHPEAEVLRARYGTAEARDRDKATTEALIRRDEIIAATAGNFKRAVVSGLAGGAGVGVGAGAVNMALAGPDGSASVSGVPAPEAMPPGMEGMGTMSAPVPPLPPEAPSVADFPFSAVTGGPIGTGHNLPFLKDTPPAQEALQSAGVTADHVTHANEFVDAGAVLTEVSTSGLDMLTSLSEVSTGIARTASLGAAAVAAAAASAPPVVVAAGAVAGIALAAGAAKKVVDKREERLQALQETASKTPWTLPPGDFFRVAGRLYSLDREITDEGRHVVNIRDKAAGEKGDILFAIEADQKIPARAALAVMHADIVGKAEQAGAAITPEVTEGLRKQHARLTIETAVRQDIEGKTYPVVTVTPQNAKQTADALKKHPLNVIRGAAIRTKNKIMDTIGNGGDPEKIKSLSEGSKLARTLAQNAAISKTIADRKAGKSSRGKGAER